MFGEVKLSEVTKQLTYSFYEQNVIDHGHDSANKTISACRVAFRYGMLKFAEITFKGTSNNDDFVVGSTAVAARRSFSLLI
jgi:hypothetical protein